MFSWDIGEWSECSKSCGLGVQYRQVLCRQTYSNRTLSVHSSLCQQTDRPETSSSCQLKICSEWQIRSDWSPVSDSCQSLPLLPADWPRMWGLWALAYQRGQWAELGSRTLVRLETPYTHSVVNRSVKKGQNKLQLLLCFINIFLLLIHFK